MFLALTSNCKVPEGFWLMPDCAVVSTLMLAVFQLVAWFNKKGAPTLSWGLSTDLWLGCRAGHEVLGTYLTSPCVSERKLPGKFLTSNSQISISAKSFWLCNNGLLCSLKSFLQFRMYRYEVPFHSEVLLFFFLIYSYCIFEGDSNISYLHPSVENTVQDTRHRT